MTTDAASVRCCRVIPRAAPILEVCINVKPPQDILTSRPETALCSRCRYSLAGLSADGACPECGTSVEASLTGWLGNAPHTLQQLKSRAEVLAIAAVALLAFSVIMTISVLRQIAHLFTPSTPAERALNIVLPIAILIAMAATFIPAIGCTRLLRLSRVVPKPLVYLTIVGATLATCGWSLVVIEAVRDQSVFYPWNAYSLGAGGLLFLVGWGAAQHRAAASLDSRAQRLLAQFQQLVACVMFVSLAILETARSNPNSIRATMELAIVASQYALPLAVLAVLCIVPLNALLLFLTTRRLLLQHRPR